MTNPTKAKDAVQNAIDDLQTVINMCEGHPEWGDSCHGIFKMGRDRAQAALYTIRAYINRECVDVGALKKGYAIWAYGHNEEMWSLPLADKTLIDWIASQGYLQTNSANDDGKNTTIQGISTITLQTPREWQPISTAPKDGSEILLIDPEHEIKVVSTYWHAFANGDGYWENLEGLEEYNPTHWMPLPTAPKGKDND